MKMFVLYNLINETKNIFYIIIYYIFNSEDFVAARQSERGQRSFPDYLESIVPQRERLFKV